MKNLITDRRLWLTAGEDRVVEQGDPEAAFLLVGCAGREIPADVVSRLGLTISKTGRIKYPGAPKLGKPAKSERAKTADEDGGGKVIKIGGAAQEDEKAADDSDRDDEPAPEWPGRTSPEKYLELYPTGRRAELAKTVIAAQDDGAGGGS